MSKSSSNLLFLAIGAAVGAAAGYVAASDKKEQWLNDINKLVSKVKKNAKGSVEDLEAELADLVEDEE